MKGISPSSRWRPSLRRPRRRQGKDPFRTTSPRFIPDRRVKLETFPTSLHPGHGPPDSHRVRTTRPHRRQAPHREDHAPPEHCQRHHGQPPGILPHRAAHRRTAGRSDRHAAKRPGRSGQFHLRRAASTPRPGCGNGQREGQAARGAQARRGHPS